MQKSVPDGAEALDLALRACLSGRLPPPALPPPLPLQLWHPHTAARHSIRSHLEAVLAAVPAGALMAPETSTKLLQNLAAAACNGPGSTETSALALFTLERLALLSRDTHPPLFAQVGQGGKLLQGRKLTILACSSPTTTSAPPWFPPCRPLAGDGARVCSRRSRSNQTAGGSGAWQRPRRVHVPIVCSGSVPGLL